MICVNLAGFVIICYSSLKGATIYFLLAQAIGIFVCLSFLKALYNNRLLDPLLIYFYINLGLHTFVVVTFAL